MYLVPGTVVRIGYKPASVAVRLGHTFATGAVLGLYVLVDWEAWYEYNYVTR